MDEKVKKLIVDLKSSDAKVREAAVNSMIYEVNCDLSDAVADLEKALSDSSAMVRWDSSKILTQYYAKKKEWSRIALLLNSSNFEVKQGASMFLQYVDAVNESLLPVLERLLSDSYDAVKGDAAGVLAKYYVKKQDWNKINELVKHKDLLVKLGVTFHLKGVTLMGSDIAPVVPSLVLLLSDKDRALKEHTVGALSNYVDQKPDNKKIVMSAITKSKIDKKLPEVQEIIKKCGA
ncbi:MAG: hypothetical protein ABII22_00655 [Candidatus Micrarchaeota archaeon]